MAAHLERRAGYKAVLYRVPCWQVDSVGGLLVEKLVEEPDVGEGPASHDGIVSSS